MEFWEALWIYWNSERHSGYHGILRDNLDIMGFLVDTLDFKEFSKTLWTPWTFHRISDINETQRSLFYILKIFFVFCFDSVDTMEIPSDSHDVAKFLRGSLDYHGILFIPRVLLHRILYFLLWKTAHPKKKISPVTQSHVCEFFHRRRLDRSTCR